MSKEHLKQHEFKPGQSGNPAGRTPMPEEIRKLRRLNRAAFEIIVDELMWMSRDQLTKMVDMKSNPEEAGKLSVVKVAIARMILEKSGRGLAYILDQSIGKATVKIEATGAHGSPLFPVSANREEREQKLKDIQAALKKIKESDERIRHSSIGVDKPEGEADPFGKPRDP